mgnify:CR=1 FL=1|jgi:hypothetical protein
MQFEPKQKQINNVNQKDLKLPCLCGGTCSGWCKGSCGAACHQGGVCNNFTGPK